MIHNEVDRSRRRSSPDAPVIRAYSEDDRPAIYDISVRTAESGGDARGLYFTDDLMPDLFAGPYLHLEPGLAFVVEDRGEVVGYVLGTADTPRFVSAYREVWIPRLASIYPVPPHPPVTRDDEALALHHNPERMLLPELAAYPSHLHINLLPSHQGLGCGRELIAAFVDAVSALGVPAIHITPLTTNVRAIAVYLRLGFHRIAVPDPGPTTYLGISTTGLRGGPGYQRHGGAIW
jgi:RimJ/RimL family protein N-acetyltransferase